VCDLQNFKGMRRCQVLQGLRLIVADLDHDEPARHEQAPGLFQDGPVGIEPIGATIEGEKRVMLPHLPVEGRNDGGGDIGRIGDD
jgi:hypothetical protein